MFQLFWVWSMKTYFRPSVSCSERTVAATIPYTEKHSLPLHSTMPRGKTHKPQTVKTCNYKLPNLDLTRTTDFLCDKLCSLDRPSDSLLNIMPISPLTIDYGGKKMQGTVFRLKKKESLISFSRKVSSS